MCSNILPCPLCSQPNFPSVDSLRISLVNVTNRPLACPICNEIQIGLDKLTIHLFSHTMDCSSSILTSTSSATTTSTSISASITSTYATATTTGTIIETNIKKNYQINERCGTEENKNDYVNDDHDVHDYDHVNENDDDDDDATDENLKNKSFEKVKSLYETATTIDECKRIQQPSELSSSPLHQSIIPPPTSCSSSLPMQINNIYELSRESTTIIASPPPASPSPSATSSQPPPTIPLRSTATSIPPTSPPPIIHSDETHLFIEPQCEICGLTFRNNELHSMHMKLVHEIDISDVNITNLLMINRSHKIICMDEENQSQKSRYQCHLCSKLFKMKGSLRVHLRVVHLFGVPGVLSSGGSGAGSSILSNVRNNYHQIMKIPLDRRNSNSPPIQNVAIKCEIDKNALFTNNSISSNSNLPDELYTFTLNVKHSGNNSPLQQQEEFERQQQQQQQQHEYQQQQQQQQILKQQSIIPGESKVWECDICTKLFTTKYFLKKHKRLHTGEMPYTCEICAKTFTFQQSYHKHLLYHNDDKPHVCKECGRAFKELSTLHNHERIHSGEKPFKCETCDKCFRQRVSYLVHRRIHTGVMPYKCTACDKSFRYKVSQRTHKCMAQPPGTVIRQTGDLLQRLIQSTVLNSMQNQQLSTGTLLNDGDDDDDDGQEDQEDLNLESPNIETQQTTNFSSQYSILNNNNLFSINNVCSNNSHEGGNVNEVGDSDLDNGIDGCNDHIRDVGGGGVDINNEYDHHQSLDELVEEHCNKIGICGENVMDNFCDMETNNNNNHSFDISIPSPTEKFQNLCLYSPQPQLSSQTLQPLQLLTSSSPSSDEIFTQTLDTIDENLLKHFLYGKDI